MYRNIPSVGPPVQSQARCRHSWTPAAQHDPRGTQSLFQQWLPSTEYRRNGSMVLAFRPDVFTCNIGNILLHNLVGEFFEVQSHLPFLGLPGVAPLTACQPAALTPWNSAGNPHHPAGSSLSSGHQGSLSSSPPTLIAPRPKLATCKPSLTAFTGYSIQKNCKDLYFAGTDLRGGEERNLEGSGEGQRG